MRLYKDVARNRNLLSHSYSTSCGIASEIICIFLNLLVVACTEGLKYGASRTSNLSLFQMSPMANSSLGIPI